MDTVLPCKWAIIGSAEWLVLGCGAEGQINPEFSVEA